MSNEDELKQAFITGLGLDDGADVSELLYRAIPAWDSIGHMALIASIEESFDVMLSTDQVLGLSSFTEARKILVDLGVDF
jgi:acyl carrier protein